MSEESLEQKDVATLILGLAFAFLPVVVILFYSKFQLKVDSAGIHYKFFPGIIKWRIIAKEMIDSFEVTAKRSFFEKIECGYSRNRLNRTTMMNISGEKFARIKLKDGRRFKIGSENPESLERALRKLTSTANHL